MALQDLTPQLRTRLHRVEKIVGLFVAVATFLLIAGFAYYLYHTAERKGWFVPKCPCFTYVSTAEGLKVKDPIILMGFSVGEITTITAQPPGSYYKVFVAFEVKRPYYGYIWTDSKAKIASADFLGRRQIEITAGYEGRPAVSEKNNRVDEILVGDKHVPLAQAPKGVFLPPDEEPALTERAEKLVSQIETALPNILSNVTVITDNLRDPHGSFGEWVIPPNLNTQIVVLATSLDQTLENLAAITSNLNTQVQTNDQMLAQISRLVIDTDKLVQGLKRHWLLRGIFKKESETNAPALKQPQK
jgi:ABC-type transporter Mla subunit MlaD